MLRDINRLHGSRAPSVTEEAGTPVRQSPRRRNHPTAFPTPFLNWGSGVEMLQRPLPRLTSFFCSLSSAFGISSCMIGSVCRIWVVRCRVRRSTRTQVLHQRASIAQSCHPKVPYSILPRAGIQDTCAISTGSAANLALSLQYDCVVILILWESAPQRVCMLIHAH